VYIFVANLSTLLRLHCLRERHTWRDPGFNPVKAFHILQFFQRQVVLQHFSKTRSNQSTTDNCKESAGRKRLDH